MDLTTKVELFLIDGYNWPGSFTTLVLGITSTNWAT